MNALGSVRQLIKTVLQQVHNFDVIAGDANAAAYTYNKRQEYQDLYNSSVAIRLREKHREVNEERPLESRLQIGFGNDNHSFQIGSASDLDCCFMAILSWGKPPGPRIMRTLWSNSRERMPDYEKRQDEDSSYSMGFEVLLKETSKTNFPYTEDVDNPMIAPQDCDNRQSERVEEFHPEIVGYDQQNCLGTFPYL